MNKYKKKVLVNLSILIVYVLFFYLINHLFSYIGIKKFIEIYKYISIGILLVSITIFEIAYNKDKGIIAIFGIEVLLLAIVTLISITMIKKFNILFVQYINFLCVVYTIYYILKFIIIYTKERKAYLKSLSDIQEIVTSEPQKREAKRKNKD